MVWPICLSGFFNSVGDFIVSPPFLLPLMQNQSFINWEYRNTMWDEDLVKWEWGQFQSTPSDASKEQQGGFKFHEKSKPICKFSCKTTKYHIFIPSQFCHLTIIALFYCQELG